MFGYKLIKESKLIDLELKAGCFPVLNEDYCNLLTMVRQYQDITRELQETICMYDEAMQEQTKEKLYNLFWRKAYEGYAEKKRYQEIKLSLELCEFAEALEQQTKEKQELQTVLDSYRERVQYEAEHS